MYKAFDLWLPAYLRRDRSFRPAQPVHILLAVCDHFEPLHNSGKTGAMACLRQWQNEFPRLIEPFADSDGCRPRQTFFYPIEQYDPDIVGELAKLCRLCGGEVELHLHHNHDTPDGLRAKLEKGKSDLARHNLLSRRADGKVQYAFIHGNWALDHSHPKGLFCGVPNELGILLGTGCFADLTMPSAPDPTQTRLINSIYYAQDTPEPKSHDHGTPVRARQIQDVTSSANGQLVRAASQAPEDNLLMVQGPLGLNWERRKFGLFPRIENGELSGSNPPTPDRMRLWLKLGIHIAGRPDWLFVKLHTHGAVPRNMAALLGNPMRGFYDHLQTSFNDGKHFFLHFVTAREMVNIIHAAEDGHCGNPGPFRDYRCPAPPS